MCRYALFLQARSHMFITPRKLKFTNKFIRDDVNEDTTAATAAQQSQAAVLAADSAVEQDRAVTERKHFPMNLNMTGFIVFSVSCPTKYLYTFEHTKF